MAEPLGAAEGARTLDSYDPFDPDVQEDPWRYYALLREEAPVYRDPKTGLFMVSSYALVVEVLKNWELFSNKFAVAMGGSETAREARDATRDPGAERPWMPVDTMLTADPPEQKRFRSLVDRAFRLKRVRSLEPRMKELWPPAGSADPVDAAARVFQTVIETPLAVRDDDGAAHYPWSFAAGGSQRLARAFGEARRARPRAPLVPELQVVLAHLLERAVPPPGGGPAIVEVPEEPGELISQALEQHRGRKHPDPEKIAWYREEIAKRTLAAAERHPRVDVRASIYRSVMLEYTDTPQAETARRELQKLITTASPQHIRLSKDFLLEYPQLWAPGALGLKRELLDGNKDNGEMSDEGITLLGLTLVEISLLGKKPVVHEVPPERFSHFIAALELASYRRLVTDERELPDPDPQRDLFFERARLGLLDEPDMRPSARSDAVFLSTTEKYGKIRPVESLLPVEIVLKGGLEDFGLAAFPRVRLPRETADAFLYR